MMFRELSLLLALLILTAACSPPAETIVVTRIVPVTQVVRPTDTRYVAPTSTPRIARTPNLRPISTAEPGEYDASEGDVNLPDWMEVPEGAPTPEIGNRFHPNNYNAARCDCSYNRYDCKDFHNHWEAQDCYEWCLEQGAGDIHWLDDDHDGIACEWLDW